MFRGLFEGPGIWIVLVVVLLLFGATRLPALARSIGQSTKIFKQEMKSDVPADEADPAAASVAQATAAPTDTVTPAPVVPTKRAKSGNPGKSSKS